MKGEELLDHFVVRFEQDTVAFTESARIFVQAKDANDRDIDLPADTKVNIVLRADERYGNLAYQSRVGKEMINVPYGDANSGQVVFAATGENPIGLEPQKVDVGVTSSGKAGMGSVWVKCKINPPRYAQGGNSPWADDHYDKAYDGNGREIKIRTLGCALSCMAMAMTALGDTVNPGELNEWMKAKQTIREGGYDGTNVNWEAISRHAPQKGLSISNPVNVAVNFELATFDQFLAKCELIIAKVFNFESVRNKPKEVQEKARKEGNHWVVIIGRSGGLYSILDPGRGSTSLSEYGRIYRYLRVFRK